MKTCISSSNQIKLIFAEHKEQIYLRFIQTTRGPWSSPYKINYKNKHIDLKEKMKWSVRSMQTRFCHVSSAMTSWWNHINPWSEDIDVLSGNLASKISKENVRPKKQYIY